MTIVLTAKVYAINLLCVHGIMRRSVVYYSIRSQPIRR